MARALWSGSISFGLINIPVELMGAGEPKPLNFHMLDSRDHAPIGYKKINKSSGHEVPYKSIVKGYEYAHDKYVIVTERDFETANPKATQTIDIEDFVDLNEVDLMLFEKPYYLVPAKNGQKGYVLLQKVLSQTSKVAIGTFVMHSKQHLVAVMARGPHLILETLRYAHEIREIEDAKYLDAKEIKKIKISPRELSMAEELVKSMTSSWNPEKYKDTYTDDLKKLIQKKIKSGRVEEAPEIEEKIETTNTNVVNLMPLLEKSLAATTTKKSRKKATGRPQKSQSAIRKRHEESKRAKHLSRRRITV